MNKISPPRQTQKPRQRHGNRRRGLLRPESGDRAAVGKTCAREPVQEETAPPVPQDVQKETAIEAINMITIEDEDKPGNPSVFGCPDCGGILWELQEGELLRFRCPVGHAYGAEGLLSTQAEALDSAFGAPFALSRKMPHLARDLAERAKKNNRDISARAFEERAEAAEQQPGGYPAGVAEWQKQCDYRSRKRIVINHCNTVKPPSRLPRW